jgi:hypothetical protein
MFCPVDRNGRPWSTVRCLRCQRVYSVHWTLPPPRLPLCIKCRRRKLTALERQLQMFTDPKAHLTLIGKWVKPE